jgi:hypothetical protein
MIPRLRRTISVHILLAYRRRIIRASSNNNGEFYIYISILCYEYTLPFLYIVDQSSRGTTHQGAYNDKLISET